MEAKKEMADYQKATEERSMESLTEKEMEKESVLFPVPEEKSTESEIPMGKEIQLSVKVRGLEENLQRRRVDPVPEPVKI